MRKNPHVRICGGLGSATTLVYPTPRIQGASFRQIADQLEVSIGTAFDDVAAELEAVCQTSREEATRLRELELERADLILRTVTKHMRNVDPNVSLRACRTAIKVGEYRSRLLGIFKQSDKPTPDKFADLSEREVAFRVEKLVAQAKKFHALEKTVKKGTVIH